MADVRDIRLMPLHAAQRQVYAGLANRTVLRIGRRWGKTALLEVIAEYAALQGKRVGFFFPDLTRAQPSFSNICATLKPAIRSKNKTDLMVELITGGCVECWTLADEHAGRSRGYDLVIIDEASLCENLESVYQLSIAPTLLVSGGPTILAGTPLGADEDSFFWKACSIKDASEQWPAPWKEFHMPTSTSPLQTADRLAQMEKENKPLVWLQEYKAEFVSWSGVSLVTLDELLVDGQGAPYPQNCEMVFATVDTAVKDGQENDGTAVVFWAVNKYGNGAPLTILDWQIEQIRADLQTAWMPSIFHRLEELAKQCKARFGSIGTFIEDRQSGQMLLQHGERVGWPTVGIPADLTQLGKSQRAMLASGPVSRQRVKLSKYAFDKVVDYKGITRNHLVTQTTSFSLGDKNAYKRADDLADCVFYGVLVALEGEQPLLV